MKEKDNILGITKTYLKEIELSEIDFELNEDIHRDWYDIGKINNRVNITKNNKGSWEGDTIPIKIDDVIKTLQQLKKSGANYAEIMYHSDHNGYVFNGLEIRKSTEKEIKEHSDKNKEKEIIEKKLLEINNEYQMKIKELRKHSK